MKSLSKIIFLSCITVMMVIAIGVGCSIAVTVLSASNNSSVTSSTASRSSSISSSAGSKYSKSLKKTTGEAETLQHTECINTDAIIITADNISSRNTYNKYVRFVVENISFTDYNIVCDNVKVNDCDVQSSFTYYAKEGDKDNAFLMISEDDLKNAGIESVKKIDLYFTVKDTETDEPVYESDCVTLKTSAYDD